MAIVEGQSESLKMLKEVLYQHKITRFNSIAEINKFTRSYEIEKKTIPNIVEFELSNEINQIQCDFIKCQNEYNQLKSDIVIEINSKKDELEKAVSLVLEKNNKSFIHKIVYYFKLKFLSQKKNKLNKNFDKIVSKKTHVANEHVIELKNKLDNIIGNREDIHYKRCQLLSKELDRIKEVVDGLYPLIAGAIGENLVLKELHKLPDNFFVFNDFKVEFYPPIYNRRNNDRIYSIQIDHLVVCNAGVFILETKNWSKESIKSFDIRSPVEQILRSSYALFILLNAMEVGEINLLEYHNWGCKQVPIRNLIVMINNKPKDKFKHVKVLTLKELNRYLEYFDSVLSHDEVENICDYLRAVQSYT